MRSADASTILRIALVLFVAYLVIIRANPIVSILILVIAFLLDGFDGYLAIREASKGKITLRMYINYSLGSKEDSKLIRETKQNIEKTARHGPRFDVAADRITEYSFWALFTVLNIVPFFVLIIIIIRHSLADAFLGSRGTSSKMKTGLAKSLYASNLSRALVNALKFVTFAYLILVYVSAYPLIIGYILIFVTVLLIIIRGAAEIYESVH